MTSPSFSYFKENKNAVSLQKRDGDAGFDLYSLETGVMKPGERRLFDTGLRMQLPKGYYGQIFPRSSMACKGVDTSAGVIDSSYRGKVKILLVNNGSQPYTVETGAKVAQLVIIKIWNSNPHEVTDVESLESSERGDGGFGSTGV